uniref:Flagellar motor rotation protein MotB n=1 Tax=uncultured Armatimonadetes bacterium TaxID=157466 RepID=A0A6J4HX37_9BACT|nr:Flagellar motor rotation protein MotB [uncultured Armatimonadetes bacterium]
MADQRIIKIVRKKSGHGGHHGGSWKVAYADFVTAMMAFFMVMWILGLDQPNKAMIQDYFNDPSRFMREYSKDPAGFVKLYRGGKNPFGKGQQVQKKPDAQAFISEASRKKFEETRESIQKAINANPDFRYLKKYVEITVTENGLKIELLEGKDSVFFRTGSAQIEPRAVRLLALVARELGALPNAVVVEGHTDVRPYRGRTDYTNWELSADRANAARRVMEASGLDRRQVVEVRGYAEKKLRKPGQPTHFSNRRVSILVTYSKA